MIKNKQTNDKQLLEIIYKTYPSNLGLNSAKILINNIN